MNNFLSVSHLEIDPTEVFVGFLGCLLWHHMQWQINALISTLQIDADEVILKGITEPHAGMQCTF